MADPTEAAAQAATRFKAEVQKSGAIRPVEAAALVRSLAEPGKGMSNTERETFFETLASYVETLDLSMPEAAERPAASIELEPEVARRMNMAKGAEIDLEKAQQLLARSLLFVIMIDQLVWGVWKNIAPGSHIKRETKGNPSLPTVLRQYVSEETSPSEEDVVLCYEKTRQLAAGLLGALGPIGRNYGTKIYNKFHPDSIKELVTKEGGKGDAKFWQKFEGLFADLSEEIVEKDIHRAIAKYTEDLLKGSRN